MRCGVGKGLDEGGVGVDDSFGLDREVEGNDRSLDTLCESIAKEASTKCFSISLLPLLFIRSSTSQFLLVTKNKTLR